MTVDTGARRWREGKVRPIPGNPPPARPVSRGVCSLRRVCDDPFSATALLQLQRTILRAQYAFLEAWRNLSVRCVITSFYPWGVSRFPVGPLPGYRTSRKEPALPIVRDEFRSAIPRSGCSPAWPVSASPTRAS